MRYRFPLALLAVCTMAPAQTVWNLAAGANLNQAFVAAAPGDILVLAPGTYQPFTLSKGLTLIGPAVIHALSPLVGPFDTQIAIPAGQRARLIGLDLQQTLLGGSFPGVAGHSVTVTGAGEVSMEDCWFGPGGAGLTQSAGTLLMQRCTVRGSTLGGGMQVTGGVCSLSNCTLQGKSALNIGYYQAGAVPALSLTGGTVTGTMVTILGGDGVGPVGNYPVYTIGSPGVRCAGPGVVLLQDSTVVGGSSGGAVGAGSVGILNNGASFAIQLARTIVQGGAGSPAGLAISGSVQQRPTMVGMRIDHALLLGQTSTATAFAGSSQQILAVVGGFDATQSTDPRVFGPVFGALAGPAVLTLTVPAPGALVPTAIGVPNVPALVGVSLWLQAFQYDGQATWSASPLVGGTVH